MRIELPNEVDNIIKTLNEAGYEAYAVGGCVRDSALGVTPKDWDITTSAKPEQVKLLFPRTIDTGIQHGTVTVMEGKTGFEVTTYRVDGEYEDGRHPKEVVFTGNLKEDLRRRDFTINAMAYHDEEGLVDIFGGMDDLEKGHIRCVGVALERFTEDALRILRAVRFSAQLGFDIEEETKEAMKELAPRLQMVSVERIYAEISKLLCSPHPEHLEYAYETGVLKQVFPELSMKLEDEVLRKETWKKLMKSPRDLWVRLTILFLNLLDVPKDERKDAVVKILRRLKTDLYTIKLVSRLADIGTDELAHVEMKVRTFLSEHGEEVMEKWLMVKEAQTGADMKALREMKNAILKRGDCICIKQLKIDGKDLLNLGVKQGKEVGETLQKLLNEVLINPKLNEKEQLKAMVKGFIE